ncbi:hypothetical protein LSAT2_009347 [Lamellibrachia satsuma]|nr:hypothetical protein LSAT2_009347 [Lamellibrachia satsuma]
MGATFSEMLDGAIVKEYTHPSKADWITAHAKATGLNLVEVDRLWLRFRQLGCDANGMLSSSVFDTEPALDDILTKNMLTAFGIQQDQDITFEQFLKIMSWATTSTLDNKIRAIFYLLNGGRNVNKDLLIRILTRTFTEGTDSQEDIAEMTQHFMQLMDPDNTEYIDEERFVHSVATIPLETLTSILPFSILPEFDDQSVLQDRLSTLPSMGSLPPSPTPSVEHQIPTDDELSTIASMVYRRDWQRLANKLGFLGDDMRQFETQHYDDTSQKVLHMLETWRDRDRHAYTDVLKRALEECSMNDAARTLSTS